MVAFGFALMVAGAVLAQIFPPHQYYSNWKDVFPAMFFLGGLIGTAGLTKWLWENLP